MGGSNLHSDTAQNAECLLLQTHFKRTTQIFVKVRILLRDQKRKEKDSRNSRTAQHISPGKQR